MFIMCRSLHTGAAVWFNTDRIDVITEKPNGCSIVCVGGVDLDVWETPEKILTLIPADCDKWPPDPVRYI